MALGVKLVGAMIDAARFLATCDASTLFEDPDIVKVTAATEHLLNGSKPLARFKKFILPQRASRLIRALRPALKGQSIPFPKETAIESVGDNRYFI